MRSLAGRLKRVDRLAGRARPSLTQLQEKVRMMTDEELLTRLDELVAEGGGLDALVARGELDPIRHSFVLGVIRERWAGDHY